jgi:AcrR family transcriptional regulator
VKYGIRRTSVQDIAAEMGVNRTTVYRQGGTVDEIALALGVRETSRIVGRLPGKITWPIGPQTIVDVIAAFVTEAREHPVLAKALQDERELIGSGVAHDAQLYFDRLTGVLEPLIGMAIRSAAIAMRDPRVVTEWLVRVGASLILIPPPGDLRAFLAELLLPALTPEPSAQRSA